MGKNPAQKAKAAKPEAKKTIVSSREKAPKKARKKTAVALAGQEKGQGKSQEKCKVGSCKRTYRAKGYCKAHYKKWRHGEYGKKRYKTCSEHDCRKPMATGRFGYCEDHFQNYYVKGITKPVAAPEPETAPKTAAA